MENPYNDEFPARRASKELERTQMKKTRIAVIDNSIDHSIYNPIRHWTISLGRNFDVFKATNNHFPDVQDFTHVILTGSEVSILEREKWVYGEIDLVLEAVKKGVSILGSCYGHQLLALALAGPRHVQKCADPEIGWISLDINGYDDFLGKKRRAYCFSSHLDEVCELPDEFLVFASSDRCRIQGFRLNGKPIWGLQIHPEMNIMEAQRYLDKRVANRHEPLQYFRAAINSQPQDSGLINDVVQNFLV
jgi:GMP synthase-like glutamine amidotransferase